MPLLARLLVLLLAVGALVRCAAGASLEWVAGGAATTAISEAQLRSLDSLALHATVPHRFCCASYSEAAHGAAIRAGVVVAGVLGNEPLGFAALNSSLIGAVTVDLSGQPASFVVRVNVTGRGSSYDVWNYEQVTFAVAPALLASGAAGVVVQDDVRILPSSRDTSSPLVEVVDQGWQYTFSEALIQKQRVSSDPFYNGVPLVFRGFNKREPLTDLTLVAAVPVAYGTASQSAVVGSNLDRLLFTVNASFDISQDLPVTLLLSRTGFIGSNSPPVWIPQLLPVVAATTFPGYFTLKATRITVSPTKVLASEIAAGGLRLTFTIDSVYGRDDFVPLSSLTVQQLQRFGVQSAFSWTRFWRTSSQHVLSRPNSFSGGNGINFTVTLCAPSATFDAVCGFKPAEAYPDYHTAERLTFTVPAAFLSASAYPVTVANTLLIRRDGTATRTATGTASASASEGSTATATLVETGTTAPSASPSLSLTATATRLASRTVSASESATRTAPPTATPTAPGSPTASASASASGSRSASASLTATATARLGPTRSPSVSGSGSRSLSGSRTPSTPASPTASASASGTASPSATASRSPSASGSASASLAASASLTVSATPSASPSPASASASPGSETPSPSASVSASLEPTRSASASASGSASPSATQSLSSATASASAPTATPSASLTHNPSPSQTPRASATPTASASPSETGSASTSPSASASSTPGVSRSRTPTGSASSSASASPTLSEDETGTPSLTPSPTPSASASGTPSATPGPTASPTRSGTPSSSATASPEGSGTGSRSASASLSHSDTALPSTSATRSATPTGPGSHTSTTSPSPSRDGTPSNSGTSSYTASDAPSPSESRTPTPLASGTGTPSPTDGGSRSPTPTGSRESATQSETPTTGSSDSRTGTPSSSKTPSGSSLAPSTRTESASIPSASPSPSPSALRSPSLSETQSQGPTASATAAPSPSSTRAPSVSRSGSGTRSPTGSCYATASQTPAPSGSPSPSTSGSGTPVSSTGSRTGSASVPGTASVTVVQSPSTTGNGSLSPTADETTSPTATPSPSPSTLPTLSETTTLTPTQSAVSSVSASPNTTVSASPETTASPSLSSSRSGSTSQSSSRSRSRHTDSPSASDTPSAPSSSPSASPTRSSRVSTTRTVRPTSTATRVVATDTNSGTQTASTSAAATASPTGAPSTSGSGSASRSLAVSASWTLSSSATLPGTRSCTAPGLPTVTASATPTPTDLHATETVFTATATAVRFTLSNQTLSPSAQPTATDGPADSPSASRTASSTPSSTQSVEPTATASSPCSISIATALELAVNPQRPLPVSAAAALYPVYRCPQQQSRLDFLWTCHFRLTAAGPLEPCVFKPRLPLSGALPLTAVQPVPGNGSDAVPGEWAGQGFTLAARSLLPLAYSYNLRLHISQNGVPAPVAASTQAWVTLRVTLAPLVADISGGSRLVFFNAAWELSSSSRDPSAYPEFVYTYEWSACRVEGPGDPADAVECIDAFLTPVPWQALAAGTETLAMAPTLILGGTSWRVTLRYGHPASGRSSSASAIITFTTFEPPALVILAATPTDSTAPVVRAALQAANGTTLLDGYSAYRYTWSSPDVDLLATGATLGGTDRLELAVSPGAFLGRSPCRVSLTITDASTGQVVQTSTAAVVVNDPPRLVAKSNATVLVQSPVLGVEAGRVPITVTVDPDAFWDADQPLSYRVAFEHEEVEYPVVPDSIASANVFWFALAHVPVPQVVFTVPVLPDTPESGMQYIRLVVYVRDALNATLRFPAPFLSPVIQDPTEWQPGTVAAYALRVFQSLTPVPPATILALAQLLPYAVNSTGSAVTSGRASAARSRRAFEPQAAVESAQLAPALLAYLNVTAPAPSELTLPTYVVALRYAADPQFNPRRNATTILRLSRLYALHPTVAIADLARLLCEVVGLVSPLASETTASLAVVNTTTSLGRTLSASLTMGESIEINATGVRLYAARDAVFQMQDTVQPFAQSGSEWLTVPTSLWGTLAVPESTAVAVATVLLSSDNLFGAAAGPRVGSGVAALGFYRVNSSTSSISQLSLPAGVNVTYHLPYPASGRRDATCARLQFLPDLRWIYGDLSTAIFPTEVQCTTSITGALVSAYVEFIGGAAPDGPGLSGVSIAFIVIGVFLVLLLLAWAAWEFLWRRPRRRSSPVAMKDPGVLASPVSQGSGEPAETHPPKRQPSPLGVTQSPLPPANPLLAFMQDTPHIAGHVAGNPLAKFFDLTGGGTEADAGDYHPVQLGVLKPPRSLLLETGNTDAFPESPTDATWNFIPPNVPSKGGDEPTEDQAEIFEWLQMVRQYHLKSAPGYPSKSPVRQQPPNTGFGFPVDTPAPPNPLVPRILGPAGLPPITETALLAQAKLAEIKGRLGIKATVLDGQLKVMHVRPNGPAAKAGVRVYDQILAMNFVPLSDDLTQFQELSASLLPGALVPLLLNRRGLEISLDVTVGCALPRAEYTRLQRVAGGELLEGDTEWIHELKPEQSGALFAW